MIFVVRSDRESCTKTISTNLGRIEADEHALSLRTGRRTPCRGNRGRRTAVGSVLCLGAAGFCFHILFFLPNAHGLWQVYGRFALFTYLIVMRLASANCKLCSSWFSK